MSTLKFTWPRVVGATRIILDKNISINHQCVQGQRNQHWVSHIYSPCMAWLSESRTLHIFDMRADFLVLLQSDGRLFCSTIFPSLKPFWLRITDEGLVPEMRIWSILLIISGLKWCIHLSRSLFFILKHCKMLQSFWLRSYNCMLGYCHVYQSQNIYFQRFKILKNQKKKGGAGGQNVGLEVSEVRWIGCLTSQSTIFKSYMWWHIAVQADWRQERFFHVIYYIFGRLLVHALCIYSECACILSGYMFEFYLFY